MGWQRLGKHLIAGWTVLVLVLLAACSNGLQRGETYDELIAREVAEAEARAFDPTGWVTVVPGFRYRLEESGIGFNTTPPLLTEEGLQRLEAYVEALAQAAATGLDRDRLDTWKRELERAWANARDWQVALPKLVQEYQMILAERYGVTVTSETAERMLRQEIETMFRVEEIEPMLREEEGVTPEQLTPQVLPSCDLAASAMRTTAQPGAKAFARGVCRWGLVAGFVYTETTAETGTQRPPPCVFRGRSSSNCRSIAFGRTGCHSTALAEAYLPTHSTWNGILVGRAFRSHSDATCR